MSETTKNVPKLRFPGFTDAWEQRKCADILSERNIQHPQSEEYPLVSFTVENGVTPKTERYEREQLVKGDKKAKNYKETRLDDIVYNPANLKFGAIARNKYGNAVFSPIYVTYEVNKTIALPAFVEMYVTRSSFIQSALQYQQGTVYERMSVNTEDFAALDIVLPSKEEQFRIGELFDQFDKAITLHQRKLNQMKEYKAGMLQKIFPKAGETVPEIRFPGFEGEWKSLTVGDLFAFKNRKNKDGSVDNVITNSAEYGLIPQRDFFDKDIAVEGHTSNYTIIEYGDFVYNPRKSANAPFGPFNCYTLDEKGIVSPLYTCLTLTGSAVTEYLLWYFKTSLWHDYIKNNGAQGGARHDRVGMTNELMKNIPIQLPSLAEQQKIATFLTDLERVISLHQRKLDAMKEYKKGLLQQMFV